MSEKGMGVGIEELPGLLSLELVTEEEGGIPRY